MEIECENMAMAEAACWYANTLGIGHLDLDVEIEFFERADENADGWIDWFEDGATIYLASDPSPGVDIMEVLAHEMVHLKQYATGQLKQLWPTVVLWEGKAHDFVNNARDWRYWNSPWEMEAFGRQQALNYMRQVAVIQENEK